MVNFREPEADPAWLAASPPQASPSENLASRPPPPPSRLRDRADLRDTQALAKRLEAAIRVATDPTPWIRASRPAHPPPRRTRSDKARKTAEDPRPPAPRDTRHAGSSASPRSCPPPRLLLSQPQRGHPTRTHLRDRERTPGCDAERREAGALTRLPQSKRPSLRQQNPALHGHYADDTLLSVEFGTKHLSRRSLFELWAS